MQHLRTIPLIFIDRFGELTWPEIYLGLQEEWLSPQSAVDIAIRSILAGSNDPDEIELARLLVNELASAGEIVSRLANTEASHPVPAAKTTWFRLIMAWLYENKNMASDPFLLIEGVYADFGYPPEIKHLVRYNPSTRAFDSKAAALQQMEDDWAEYVCRISLKSRI